MADSKFALRLADRDLQARVKPITLQRYKSAILSLTSWAKPLNWNPSTPEDWDDLLLEFKFAHDQITRPKFTVLVSAVEFFVPSVKRQLAWSHAMISGWARRSKIRHTVPLTYRPAVLVAIYMAVRGKKRLGLGLLLQVKTGLRPSELLALLPDHVMFPEDQGSAHSGVPVVIALGVKAGTKANRTQVAMLRPEHEHLWAALRALKRATPPGYFLFPFTLAAYRMELQAVERILGLKVGWGPHSPRAGYATDGRLEGVPFEEIREGGRWQSDSSLRTYLDIVASAAVVRALRLRQLGPQLDAAQAAWPLYFG